MENELTEEDLAREDAARFRQRAEDYHFAISGEETGRRNGHGGRARREAELAKETRLRAFRDALERMLQDPEYRALYEELGTRLAEAEYDADAVIADLEASLRDLDAQISDMEARAAKGPDGQPVFKTADGRVVDAHGRELPPEIAAGIIWPPGAPSAEDYFDAKDQRVATDALLDDWRGYRNDTLGGLRDRHSDRDDPMTKDEMRDALRKIQESAPRSKTVEIAEPESSPLQSASLSVKDMPLTLR